MRTLKILSACLLTVSLASAEPHGVPYASVGKLETSRIWNTSVNGPQLSWQISHPSSLADVVALDPATNAMVTRKELRLRVHVLGMRARCPRAAFWSRLSGQDSWELLFDGSPRTVTAHESVLDRVLPANTSVDLAGRGYGGESWLDLRSTGVAAPTVRAFKAGDPAPSQLQHADAPFLSAFLSSDPGSRLIQIGPKELLFCFELNATEATDPSFDLQDLVVLVSFDEV